MKKIVFLCVIVAMVFSPMASVKAEGLTAPVGATQEQIQALYQSLMQQLVALLMEQLADLRAQLAEVQRVQSEAKAAPVVQSVVPVQPAQQVAPVVTQPIEQPTAPVVTAPVISENFYPQIAITAATTTVAVGTEVSIEWSAASLRQDTQCKVNRKDVEFGEPKDRGVYKFTPQAPGEYPVEVSCVAIPGNFAGSKKVTVTAY